MNSSARTSWAGTLVAAVLMGIAGYAALFVAPEERTMHEIQRIFYHGNSVTEKILTVDNQNEIHGRLQRRNERPLVR